MNAQRIPRAAPRRSAGAPLHSDISVVLQGVRQLDRGLRLAARTVERKTGLSAAQLFVLEQLSVREPLSLSELAERTLTDRSSVSAVVDRLEAAGFLNRRIAVDDRRRAEVRITARGRAILHRAPTPPTHLLLDALRRLPRESVEQLGHTLAELNAELGFAEATMLFEDR
ncbi:MAG: MarR family transcriptional regulator [Gemmatimonadaceae bacterium]